MKDMEGQVAEARVLSSMLVDVSEQAKATFGSLAEAFGLPVHLARAIVLLAAPMPMGDLAAQLACDRSYVTAIADQLKDRGLVDRIPGADRRVKLLSLTEKGTRLREELSQAVAEGDLVMHRLDAAQRNALLPLLEALLKKP